MDDFLYIIIGIIWVVYSLYSNKQKQQKKRMLEEQRRNQPDAPPAPPRPRSFLEQMLDPETEMPEPVTQPYDEYQEEQEEYSFETLAPNQYKPEIQSLETITNEVSGSYFENQYTTRGGANYYDNRVMSDSTHNEVPLVEELTEEFDLKKAVIYSEILNPRYI
jgi:hypothetical protein